MRRSPEQLGGRETLRVSDICARGREEIFTAPTISDEVAFWLYTSGSTGDPKGVKHVHSSLMATAKLMGQGVLGIRESDVVLSAAKLFFAYGLGNAMSFPMSVGATAILWPDRPTPDAMFDLMQRHHPSIFYAVPSLYAALLAHPRMRPRHGFDSGLRLCVSAGEALPASVGRALARGDRRRCARRHWLDRDAADFPDQPPGDIRYGSTGKPVRGYDVKIVDENGCELPDGEIGELVVRGPSAGEGYWNQRQKEPPHLCRRMDPYRRQILSRPGRLLLLLRSHRRHVQGQRHVGVAFRCRGGVDLA